MQFSVIALLSLATGSTYAALHNSAACVSNKVSSPSGGSGWSVSYNWKTTYDVLPDATKCACDLYRARNTGSKQWDQCPDCAFDGLVCGSAGKHIGGDEMTYYCSKKCGASGSEAD